jgi:hypothetical protein
MRSAGYADNIISFEPVKVAYDQLVEKSLPSGLQLEMSLVPLYNNELLFPEFLRYLNDRGYSLYSLENGFSNPDSGQLLQVDGIFFRKDLGL